MAAAKLKHNTTAAYSGACYFIISAMLKTLGNPAWYMIPGGYGGAQIFQFGELGRTPSQVVHALRNGDLRIPAGVAAPMVLQCATYMLSFSTYSKALQLLHPGVRAQGYTGRGEEGSGGEREQRTSERPAAEGRRRQAPGTSAR